MKKVLVSLMVFVCATVAFAAPGKSTAKATQQGAVSTSVNFNGKKYYLQYSAGNSQQWLNEYLPSGASFNSYTEMFTVRSYDTIEATPQQMGSNMIAVYQQQYPNNQYQFFPGLGDDAGLSYIAMQGNILEFNLFRFTTVNGHPLALQFVYREYMAQDHKPAMAKMAQTVKANLNTWKQQIMTMPVPAINRTPKQ